jgi:hypothetical protein
VQFRIYYETLCKIEKYLERENERIEREAAEAAEAQAAEADKNEDEGPPD